MRIKRLQTVLHCILIAGAAAYGASAQTPSATPAQDVGTLMVNVVYEHAGGTLWLNGIPINRFGASEPGSGDSGTLFVGNGIASFGRNGINTLKVEAKANGAEGESSTELVVFDAKTDSADPTSAMDHPLFRKKIAGAGSVEYTLTLRNIPYHLFDDATPWSGDPNAVLTAVQALHKALAARDMKAVGAFIRPYFESMPDARQMGSFDEMIAGFGKQLKESKVAVLPAKLHVESFYEGRLFRVTDSNGASPIRASAYQADPHGHSSELLEMGTFWCYRNGAWVSLGD